MLHVASPEALREEHLDELPDELTAPVAEQALGLVIDEPDPPGPVGDDGCIGNGLDELPESAARFRILDAQRIGSSAGKLAEKRVDAQPLRTPGRPLAPEPDSG
jgi:hypothetical protein